MTKGNKLEEARALAMRPYRFFAFLDQTTDDETIYVATNPELPGCIAQGETMEEAEEILAEVRIDYIAHLLANDLSVPTPKLPRLGRLEIPPSPFDYRILSPKVDEGGEETTDLDLQFAVFA